VAYTKKLLLCSLEARETTQKYVEMSEQLKIELKNDSINKKMHGLRDPVSRFTNHKDAMEDIYWNCRNEII